MQLRDHPILLIRGIISWWPPTWVSTREGPQKKLRGELGILVSTILNQQLAQHLFIRMEYEQEPFLGALHVRDEALCYQFHILMQQHLGKSIKEIGDLEVDSVL